MDDGEAAWREIGRHAERPALTRLFEAEPDRLSSLVIEEAGIRFDFAKTHLDATMTAAFLALGPKRRASPRSATRCSPASASTPPRIAPPSTAPSAATAHPTAWRAPAGSTRGCGR